MMRVSTTAPETSAASPSSVAHERLPSASTIAGSCSPTSTNRSAFRMNWRIRQTASFVSRDSGVVSSGVCQPR